MHEIDRPHDVALLILDFDGVCVRGIAELRGDPLGSLADTARPEALKVIAAAGEAGVTTVILSNELDPAWADVLPVLGAVDHVISCADNGILKPDRRAFQRCLLLTGASAEATLVVDDNADNVRVAASLGMKTVLFDTADPGTSWASVHRALTGGEGVGRTDLTVR